MMREKYHNRLFKKEILKIKATTLHYNTQYIDPINSCMLIGSQF